MRRQVTEFLDPAVATIIDIWLKNIIWAVMKVASISKSEP